MKYIAIIIAMSLMFSSCTTKPSVEDNGESTKNLGEENTSVNQPEEQSVEEWTIYEEDYPIPDEVIADIQLLHSGSLNEENIDRIVGETRGLMLQYENENISEAVLEQTLHTVRYIESLFPENIENLYLYADIYLLAEYHDKAIHQYRKILNIDSSDEYAHEEVLRLDALLNNEEAIQQVESVELYENEEESKRENEDEDEDGELIIEDVSTQENGDEKIESNNSES